MALRLNYFVRETGTNLARNLTITIASVLTVFVSLVLVGSSLLVRQGVENATKRWEGGIEFIIFLQSDVTNEELAQLESDLESSPDIERATFVDQEEAYEEFLRLFEGQSDLIESVTPDVLPPSFRVVPVNKSADAVTVLSGQFEGKAGVREVASAVDTIRAIQDLSKGLSVGIAIVAIVLLVVAVLLILNTIRMAIYARRHEIEVMKLVGATNWFVRIPFMIEGLFAGAVGAGLAILTLVLSQPMIEDWLPDPASYPLLTGLSPANADLFGTSILLGVLGCVVGAISSAVAAVGFLDV